MSSASTSNDRPSQMLPHRDEIFALRDQVRNQGGAHTRNDSNGVDGSVDGNCDDEEWEDSGSIAFTITSAILESTIVPAMKDLLKEQGGSKRKKTNAIEEKKEAGEIRRTSRDDTDPDNDSGDFISSSNSNSKNNTDDENNRVEYTTAILECLLSFVAATCATPKTLESPTQETSYNSLSFRRSSTPKKQKNSSLTSESSSNPKEDKALFVTCGAFDMSVCMLRKVLDEHVVKASSSSWSRNKRADLDTFDSIGVADSSADVKIESCQPENEIPAMVMHLIACLTHNASDSIKNDAVLPHLSTIIHKSMMVFLPSPEVQAYGCWTLYSLSNPLLQELIAAGSVSVLVRAMKCHHSDSGVQKHGNKSLYNLLPLLAYCTKQNKASENDNNESNLNPLNQSSANAPASAICRIEIDGEQLEDYSSLLPGLPAIVLRGMESHPGNLDVQQYGLLVLMRLCQQEQETYEVIISEGGLMTIMHVVTMATKAKLTLGASDHNASGYDDPHGNNNHIISEKYDCLAQMACQFLRDISRPTNSSMDILRIIAVKGGIKTVLQLLDHYNQENLRCGGGSSGLSSYYGNHQRFAIINIIDPAMACLRNLMTNEDNRREVMIFASMAKSMQKEQQSSGITNAYGDSDDEAIMVCANLMPIVLKTMDAYPLDAPIQAYGCDLLGRLAQGEPSARVELIQTTIDPDAFSASGRADRKLSRLLKKTGSVENSEGNELEDVDAEVVDLSNQMQSSVISSSPKYKKKKDALVTAVRSMRNHRNHQGVQERTVALILAIVVDRDVKFTRNGGSNASQSSSSYYLIQRLQEVYDFQKETDDPASFLALLQSTSVPPKGIERLKTLTKIVDDYDRKKIRDTADHPSDSSNSGPIGNFFRGWI